MNPTTTTDIFSDSDATAQRANWLCAGMRSTLLSHNSYLTREFHGIAIVVCIDRNGIVRAFENACAHRQMPIQPGEFGRRALICPYHAWTYDHTGRLRAVANAYLYGMRRSERESIRLRSFAVQIVGGVIFVNMSERPRPLSEQIPDVSLDCLRKSSPFWSASYLYMHCLATEPAAEHAAVSEAKLVAKSLAAAASVGDGMRIESIEESLERRLASTPTSSEAIFEPGRAKSITCQLGDDLVYQIVGGRIFILEQTIRAAGNDMHRHIWVLCTGDSAHEDQVHLMSACMKDRVASTRCH